MRVIVDGNNLTARGIREHLTAAGHQVCARRPRHPLALYYTVEVREEKRADILFDSVDSHFEREVMRHIRSLTLRRITVQTAGGNQSPTKMVIVVPADDDARTAVEVGVMRAVDCLRQAPPRKPRLWFLFKQ